MGSEVVEINCLCFHFIFDSLRRHLSYFNECKCTEKRDDLIVDLKLSGKEIKINLTYKWMRSIHVCVVDRIIGRSNEFSDVASDRAQEFRNDYPNAPIIIACNFVEGKYRPGAIKQAELNGDKMMTRKIGDKLARELGAVKYIEYSGKTGRGAKILIDEIAFAGIGKIKDDEKQHNKRKCSIL